MKLSKAIEILTCFDKWVEGIPDPDTSDAIKLAIKVLEERQEAIDQGLPLWHELLPGETKDRPLHSLGFNTGNDESP